MKTPRTSGTLAGVLAWSALAACLPCDAAITWVDPADIQIPNTFAGIYLDIKTETATPSTGEITVGIDSYTISYTEPAGDWDVNFFFGGAAMVHSDSINIYRAADDNTSAIHNLGSGTLVDGATVGSSQLLGTAGFGGSGAFPADPHMGTATLEFTSGIDGYLGFVLDDPGGPLYGWMRVELHGDGSPGYIKEWAYSTSPLQVGQVPEPTTTAALATLALAALTLGRRREPATTVK